MATVYSDECCMCPPELGCLGIYCPKRRRLTHVCDSCGETLREEEYADRDGRRGAAAELCAGCAGSERI